MSREQEALFESWAPPNAPWSPWAKPVLFAHAKPEMLAATTGLAALPIAWADLPRADGTTAVVLELPGLESIQAALSLAEMGYRPVPLFNTTPGRSAVLDAEALIVALARGAVDLSRLDLGWEAPPAFMLDRERLAPKPRVGQYDNRWVVFPQDFPSAELVATRGIRQVLVVQRGAPAVADDLRDILISYRKAGLEIGGYDLAKPGLTGALTLPSARPWRWIRAMALLALGLRANSAGGFGSMVPQPSSG